ncbi:MAG: RHS repeat protein, partial [Caldilineales bacterium]|nr:RHS repeat protein [Caldilineales bacterium]
MSESYQFPVINSIGFPVLLTLRYSTSNDTPTAKASVPFTITSQQPERATWRLDFQGRSYTGEGFNAEAFLDTRNALGERVAPGLYPFTATETFFYTSGARPSLQVEGNLEVRRGDIWPFGYSWMTPYDTLIVDRTDSATLIHGDGQHLIFRRTASGAYQAPTPGVGTLLRYADRTWLFTDQGGLRRWFNENGRLTKIENRNGIAHTLTYEENGVTLPPGVWGLRTRLKSITDGNGGVYSFEYGTQGYIDKVTDPAGRIFTLTHDAEGNLRSITDALGRTTSYEYDNRHLLTRIVHPEGDDTRIVYDENRRMVSHENAQGDVRTGAYLNNRNVFVNERGIPTTYQFNRFGAVTRVTNPEQSVDNIFDNNRQFIGTDQPYARYEYDDRGNRITENTHFSIRRTYDPVFNQVASVTDGARNTTFYGYDSRGNLTTITDPTSGVTRFTYDALGQLTRITDPLGNTNTTSYDSAGNPVTITDSMGFVTAMSYDDRGNIVRTTDAEGNVEEFAYDAMDRMTVVTDGEGHETELHYDENDNIVAFTDGRGNDWAYGYDTLNRLTGETGPLDNSKTYQFDPVGNVTSVTQGNGDTISYAYDDASRMTREEMSDGNVISYSWNGVNDLVAVQDDFASTTFAYLNQIKGSADTVVSQIRGTPIETTIDYDYVVVGSTVPAQASARRASAPNSIPEPDPAIDPAPPSQPPFQDDSPPPPKPAPLPGMEESELDDVDEPLPTTQPEVEDTEDQVPYQAIPTAVATDVCGTIGSNTTWNAAGSPYVVTCDVYVNPGVTLTINPGVVVKFNSFWEDIQVNGTLLANGSAGSPIIFTSLKDDTAGGDTNGDGGATTPAPEDWSSLRFLNSSTGSVLNHAIVRYGGGQYSENIYVATSDVSISNSTIAWSKE